MRFRGSEACRRTRPTFNAHVRRTRPTFQAVYRSILVLALAAGASLMPARVDAMDPSPVALVAVGEVSTSVVRPGVDVPGVLRAAVTEELPSLDLSRARRRPVILSVSLLRMETESTAEGAATTCVISAALRTKKGGNIFAVLEGRAKAQSDTSAPFAQERLALRTAVRGALQRIPEALAQ
ncbi:hypothetical protein [Pendulispora albinea]|uniref:Uncharacterized protein n=1 Tax=Pendulispora albinea TaxID=2741071 RepID=A0ABZ2LTJ5_9BACT